jgi:5-methyltetrahydropteroyltriglutamate--homocysteine methyltransferase
LAGRFALQEIGSLKKPLWRLQAYRGDPVSEQALREAETWGQRLGVEGYRELLDLLGQPDSPEKRRSVLEWSIRYALRFFESVGLDRVYTGEQARVEMYEHVARRVQNFEIRGSVNSLDYAYYSKGAIVGRPVYKQHIYLDEFLIAKRLARRPLKVPITGPYTMVDWSFNEYYEGLRRRSIGDWRTVRIERVKLEGRRDFLLDLVDAVYRPEIRALVEAGAEWIQVDEPALTSRPEDEEMRLFVEAWNRMVEGFPCRFSLHNCYSDYRLLARFAPQLKKCSQLALEFANRDSLALGVTGEARPGYQDLRHFVEWGYEGEFGLGLLHVHRYDGGGSSHARVVGGFLVESPELVRDRILYACSIVGADRIACNPDCGGRRMPWEVYHRKLQSLRRGAELAAEVIGC